MRHKSVTLKMRIIKCRNSNLTDLPRQDQSRNRDGFHSRFFGLAQETVLYHAFKKNTPIGIIFAWIISGLNLMKYENTGGKSMFKKIQNLTRRLVILRLNSGRSLFVGPGDYSGEIPEVDLANNSMFQKLKERGIIAVHPAVKKHPSKRPKKKMPAPAAGKKKPDAVKTTKSTKTMKSKETKNSYTKIKPKGGE
jgi:hypothetical protein